MSRAWSALVPLLCLGVWVTGCGKGAAVAPKVIPTPVSKVAESASAGEIDSLWTRSMHAVRHAKWGDAIKDLGRAVLELPPGDPRAAQAHFFLGEAQLA